MEQIISLLLRTGGKTLLSLAHNWPYLLTGILAASVLKVFMKSEKVSALLLRYRNTGVVVAVGAAVATPFCSCGTTAVMLGMMAGAMPIAPIIAFMVASPLSSPNQLVLSAGLFGWPFAIWHFGASILLGLTAGVLATVLENRGWLKNQTRFATAAPKAAAAAGCQATGCPAGRPAVSCPTTGCREAALPEQTGGRKQATAGRCLPFLRALAGISSRMIPLFVGFAFLGYLLNDLIPAAWISEAFGSGKIYGIPLAASLGLPLYVSAEAALPLVRALMDAGMSQGAVMAFLLAGSGTSLGAITGALAIVRWKVVLFIALLLWTGSILAGWGIDLVAAAGLL